jgi:hypothetical protein
MKTAGNVRAITVRVTDVEVSILDRLAYYYLSMRPVRFIIRFTAPMEMRARIKFISEESKWLRRFARSTRDRFRADGTGEADVAFTVRASIAFWGRLLASLNTPRSRRKLSAREVERRQALASKFQAALGPAARNHRKLLEAELATRRPIEQVWMRERLGLRPHHSEASEPTPSP